MIPLAKLAQKRAKLRAKQDGTSVTLKWTEWPDGAPELDPTSGAALGSSQPVEKSASVRAFVHFANPAASGYRKFAEIETGDAIVDFPLDLLRVADAGDTDLTADDVVDELAFAAANRAIGDSDESATSTDVEPTDLENLKLEFAGKVWVQKEVGQELARCWDTLYTGLNINRALLLRPA